MLLIATPVCYSMFTVCTPNFQFLSMLNLFDSLYFYLRKLKLREIKLDKLFKMAQLATFTAKT